MGELRIGTSGWNYPRGNGTWNGVFYPPSRQRPRGFDELRYYAEHFNTVEVNSTFYGQPRAAVTAAWAERVPAGFEFSIKLYQKFTHPQMFVESLRKSLAPTMPEAEALQALARPGAADVDEFRRGVEPLANSGRLGALLAQFPASFKHGEGELAYLTSLLTAFKDYQLAVELRHKSWSDALVDVLTLLNAFDAAWVQIDEPRFRSSIRQNQLPNVPHVYYMRLHGRNAAQWWQHSASEDRYNYHYSTAELQEFADDLDAVRHIVKKAYLYTNNHYSAKSVANAAMIKHQLGEPIEGDYRDEMRERFPELATIAPAIPARRLV